MEESGDRGEQGPRGAGDKGEGEQGERARRGQRRKDTEETDESEEEIQFIELHSELFEDLEEVRAANVIHSHKPHIIIRRSHQVGIGVLQMTKLLHHGVVL